MTFSPTITDPKWRHDDLASMEDGAKDTDTLIKSLRMREQNAQSRDAEDAFSDLAGQMHDLLSNFRASMCKLRASVEIVDGLAESRHNRSLMAGDEKR